MNVWWQGGLLARSAQRLEKSETINMLYLFYVNQSFNVLVLGGYLPGYFPARCSYGVLSSSWVLPLKAEYCLRKYENLLGSVNSVESQRWNLSKSEGLRLTKGTQPYCSCQLHLFVSLTDRCCLLLWATFDVCCSTFLCLSFQTKCV